MEEGYYSKRLDELEKRKEELQGKIVTAKLSLKGVDKEIESCKEAMNNQTSAMRTDADRKDEKIASLTKQVVEAENLISELKLNNTQLKHDLQNSEQTIKKLKLENVELKDEIRDLKIDIENLKSDGHTVFSEKRADENIFDQILRGVDEK